MTTDDKIRDEKIQYDIKRKIAKIWALLSRKIDKYKYLMGEEILPCNRNQIIEQAKFTYSSLGKALERETEKQVDALKFRNISNKTDELKQIESIFLQDQINSLIYEKLKNQ